MTARLDEAVDDLDGTIKDIRRTIFALGSLADSSDLQAEVTRLVERAATTLKFRPTLTIEGPVRTLVPPQVAPDLLAVLGEALSNASRHADASSVDVRVVVGDDILVSVADDGRGFADDVRESGLGNMRERALKHGGSLEVTSTSGRGTTVEWRVPAARSSAPECRRAAVRQPAEHAEPATPGDRALELAGGERAADVVDEEVRRPVEHLEAQAASQPAGGGARGHRQPAHLAHPGVEDRQPRRLRAGEAADQPLPEAGLRPLGGGALADGVGAGAGPAQRERVRGGADDQQRQVRPGAGAGQLPRRAPRRRRPPSRAHARPRAPTCSVLPNIDSTTTHACGVGERRSSSLTSS